MGKRGLSVFFVYLSSLLRNLEESFIKKNDKEKMNFIVNLIMSVKRCVPNEILNQKKNYLFERLLKC